MSNRNRLLNIAAGGIAAGLLALSVLMAGLNEHSHQHRRGNEAAQQELSVAGDVRAIPIPPSNPEPDREEWREERDLQAQREMAEWAKWMFVATAAAVVTSIAGVMIAGLGVLFVRDTLRATNEQVRIARESERPLFFITARSQLTDDLKRSDWGIEDFDAEVIVENVGTRPAIVHTFRAVIDVLPIERPVPPLPDELIARGRSNRWLGGRDIKVGESGQTFVSSTHLKTDIVAKEREQYLYLTGLLQYEDGLGVFRERGFCFMGDLPGGLLRKAFPNDLYVAWRRFPDEKRNFDRRMKDGERPAQ